CRASWSSTGRRRFATATGSVVSVWLIVNEVNNNHPHSASDAGEAVDGRRQKNLALILARQFAATLAMPMFVADAEGRLVFFHKPAGRAVARPIPGSG